MRTLPISSCPPASNTENLNVPPLHHPQPWLISVSPTPAGIRN